MAFSELPLSYCTNVHPGETFEQAFTGLKSHTGPLAEGLDFPVAAGLWMTRDAISQCGHDPKSISAVSAWLEEAGLVCYTMNAFPFGNFHARRVKENVYLPDWTSAERREYTCDVASLLAQLLPAGVEGSISTSPCAFKTLAPPGGYKPYFAELINAAVFLADSRRSTGKTIRLAIEPEPWCVLETTTEAIDFFTQLRRQVAGTGAESAVLEHLGLCYDVCHQAVEFENVADSIARIHEAKIRINKVHVTCALELPDPRDADAREHLARFAEERYLHQTFGKTASGETLSLQDLTADHASNPPADWLDASAWRVHFHVPVNEERLGSLRTTRPVLVEALRTVRELPYSPHLEVETYTWNVLPTDELDEAPFDLVSGLRAEMSSAHRLLASLNESVD